MSETRTAAILAAIAKELRQRAALLDQATDLVEVTVTVKLQAGQAWVRGTTVSEQRVCRVRDGYRA